MQVIDGCMSILLVLDFEPGYINAGMSCKVRL